MHASYFVLFSVVHQNSSSKNVLQLLINYILCKNLMIVISYVLIYAVYFIQYKCSLNKIFINIYIYHCFETRSVCMHMAIIHYYSCRHTFFTLGIIYMILYIACEGNWEGSKRTVTLHAQCLTGYV